MPKVVRVNFKSGVLPRPRQVVPNQFSVHELAEKAKIRNTFEDAAMAPKGSSPNPPPRLPKTAEQKIALSAKEPHKRSANSEEKAWSQHIADVRRSYLKSTLLKYEEHEAKHMAKREERQKVTELQAQSKLKEVTQTLADSLTTPTIESSLLSEFVIKRTEEEQAELKLRREYNRKLTEHQILMRQQEKLVQLYQDSASYIVTEEQLEEKLQSLFKPEISVPRIGEGLTQNPPWWKYVNNEASRVMAVKEQTREAQLLDALNGTVQPGKMNDGGAEKSRPGLKAVRNALNQND